MPTQQYMLWREYPLVISWIGNAISDSKAFYITWDERKTFPVSFKVFISAAGSSSTTLDLLLNDNQVARLNWALHEGGLKKQTTVNAINYLKKPNNLFVLNYFKDFWYPLEARAYVTVMAEFEYEGEPPRATEFSPKDVLLYGAIASIAVSGGIIAYGLARRR